MYNCHGPRQLSVSASNDASKVGSGSHLRHSPLPGSASPKTGRFQFFRSGKLVEYEGEPDDGGGGGEEGQGD